MKPFDKILVPVDFSDNSDYAFNYALSIAKQFDSELVVMHVINEPVDLRGFYVPHISFEQIEKEIENGAETMMKEFCQNKLGEYSKYQSVIITGIPYEEIIRKSEEINATLIIIGTHGRTGLDHIIFGSTAERVVRGAACPVLSVRLPAA